ncbi:MAG: 3-keto-5-aminohexanoate cleavage protein [Proteobacteria bacterium]|nr:3-keto-5-aminohexanoate cleavage protein [Pseudomonadota bacterium]MBU1585540.1 3-keto-5-aminohexanoate cleavage protein [Pseudomonadota bacterium]MBU2630046.1 3-keto-5-aminohexanoate cleavage protein [Pseudomonadota bacterium]
MENQELWDFRNPYEWMKKTATSTLPPLIICVAITGGVQGKEANPNLPETLEEQLEQTYESYKAGASMVHTHTRDPESMGDCTGEPERIRQLNAMIREKCPDIIINNSTSAAYGMSIEDRIACLNANPESASLNLGPDMYKLKIKERKAPLLHPRKEQNLDSCTMATYNEISIFARMMKEKGIRPEMELYHPGQYWVVRDLISQGVIEPPFHIQYVLGYVTSIFPTPANLISLVNELPPQTDFSVAGLGPYQLPMSAMSIIMGGHVRVGMEDNVYYKKGRLLKHNAEAVERIVRLSTELNREIATPVQARKMLGFAQTPSMY